MYWNTKLCETAKEAGERLDAWTADYLAGVLEDSSVISIVVSSPRTIHTERRFAENDTVHWGTVRLEPVMGERPAPILYK